MAADSAITLPDKLKNKKVAIVHDWLYGGGAERVVFELHQLFPDAPIYTSYCSPEWRRRLDDKVVTGYLQRWPFNRLRRMIPFLRIQWFESLDLSGYDIVISSSGNGEAKGVCAGTMYNEGQLHICYCHTPTHFYWRHYDEYMRRPGFGALDPLARVVLKLLLGPLRKWDLKASKRPDYYIANSEHIKSDIQKFYGRDSTVIHPSVDTARFEIAEDTKTTVETARKGFVAIGRHQPYKRFDLIVEACTKLKLPLTVVGSGPDTEHLKKLAGPTVKFVSKAKASDEDVVNYLRSAEAFIFAAYEDFGITPIEAMAAGTPVIAYKAGGAFDYVEPGITGEFFDEQTVDSLMQALKAFNPTTYDHAAIAAEAEQFSSQNFKRKTVKLLATLSAKNQA